MQVQRECIALSPVKTQYKKVVLRWCMLRHWGRNYIQILATLLVKGGLEKHPPR